MKKLIQGRALTTVAKRWWRLVLVFVLLLLSLYSGQVRAWSNPFVGRWLANAMLAKPPLATLTATLTGSQFGIGAAGTIQTQRHRLTNNGPLPETFKLTVDSRQGWSVTVNPTQVQLTPGQSITVTTSLSVPSDAAPGVMAVTTLTVTNALPAPPILLRAKDTLLVQGSNALNVPALQQGTLIHGQRVYTLTAMSGETQFLPGLQTPTNGYNGSFLGPTLVMTTGEVISVSVTNLLTEATTVHWHGLHLPGKMDGGPHQGIQPGTVWRPTFTMLNQASTPWYHPHPHVMEGVQATMANMVHTASTGDQVYSGLAGMILVRDQASAALNLPHTYGVDEFPIVVQDRNFNADGSFRPYPVLQNHDLHKGDYFLINGTLAGNLSVPAQMVRLHLLNGSNARFYKLGFSDNRNFYQIASDNALLNQPVQRNRLTIGPGERMEIVVDLHDLQDKTLYFVHYGEEIDAPPQIADDYDVANLILFSLHGAAPTANPVTTLPTTLNHIVRLDRSQAVITRTLLLNIPPSINFKTFNMDVINITSTLGTKEIWTIVNLSDEAHPLHIHDSPFQILTRNGEPPPDYESGWKDTVIVPPLQKVELIKDFSNYADPDGPFMYHCHILDHEDKGMMGQFVIQPQQSVYLPRVER